MAHTIEQFKPDEVIIFFHLSNDFQIVAEPEPYQLVYEVGSDGKATIHEDSWQDRHNLQHYILHGYEYDIDLVKTIKSHHLSARFIKQLSVQTVNSGLGAEITPNNVPSVMGVVDTVIPLEKDFDDVRHTRLVDVSGTADALFSQRPNVLQTNAFAVATTLLKQAYEQLSESGAQVKIVTIPAFSPAFYEQPNAERWQTEFGDLDLFLPERVLVDFAQNAQIPIIAMGETLQGSGRHTTNIQKLFFKSGTGHLTQEGHMLFAEAMASCFAGWQSDVGPNLSQAGCYTSKQ